MIYLQNTKNNKKCLKSLDSEKRAIHSAVVDFLALVVMSSALILALHGNWTSNRGLITLKKDYFLILICDLSLFPLHKFLCVNSVLCKKYFLSIYPLVGSYFQKAKLIMYILVLVFTE